MHLNLSQEEISMSFSGSAITVVVRVVLLEVQRSPHEIGSVERTNSADDRPIFGCRLFPLTVDL
jgi:hypothetical protein